ncbi:hypothetical protein NX059_001137 [Plenodomus lindquistii]|nr:hypothetical protein NX059_001137 [Plenodomus lindquistii]
MPSISQQQYGAPARPAFAPLQSTASAHSSGYSTTTTMSTRSSTAASAPPASPSTSPRQQNMFGSLNQQTQQPHPQRPQSMQPQRHPSFEYQPNRAGAGQTAAETANFLAQTSLLAEAAKRAQMACVMRDLDGMEL